MDCNGLPPSKAYNALVKSIDWSRMARPRSDKYDTRKVAALARELYDLPTRRTKTITDAAMFDGRVPLVHLPQQPSSELRNAPTNHPNIARAEKVLRLWPAMYEQCATLITSIRPLINASRMHDAPDGDHGAGCSCGNTTDFGGIESTVHGGLGFAEGIVHELGHWKLHAMGVHLETWTHLVANDPEERFESPIRKDQPRPMGACIQAQYSYLHVLELNIVATKHGIAAGMMPLNRDRMAAGRETLKQWKPTAGSGRAFAKAMDAWAVQLITEADALLARA